MLPYNTTDRLNMAVYSRLSLTDLSIKSISNKERKAKITMYAEFLILVIVFLIIKRLEKLDK